MTAERRDSPRIPVTTEVIVECAQGHRVLLTTRDLSGGGVLLSWGDSVPPGCDCLRTLQPGNELVLQVSGGLGGGEDAPRVPAWVVRVLDDGIAASFVAP